MTRMEEADMNDQHYRCEAELKAMFEEQDQMHRCWKACMTTLAIAAGILIATVVVADARQYFLQPPAKYAGEPVNYEVRNVSADTIRIVCGNRESVGCTGVPENPLDLCIILMPKKHWLYDELLTHEKGHCNGWPANHPNGRMP